MPGRAWLKLKQWVLRMVRHSMVEPVQEKVWREGEGGGGREGEEGEPRARRRKMRKLRSDFPKSDFDRS